MISTKYRFLRFPEGKPKAVTFSYDDGTKTDLRLAETLDRYGMKGTFNLNSDWLSDEKRLTLDEIRLNLLGKGHEVAVHGASHKANGQLRPLDGILEVLECRKTMEQSFGRIIRGMAYPDSGITRWGPGISYESVRHYLADLEIAYARTLGGDNDNFLLPTDWYAWMPTAHHNNPLIFEYIDKFLKLNPCEGYASGRYPRLFYIWGHSIEFLRNNNWERLDLICEKLGSQPDTWYATNMEIFEYVRAYESLIFSVDNSIVYNPTVRTVWFYMDEIYRIDPGQTLVLNND